MNLPNCYRCGCQPCECADGITLYHADCRDVLPLLRKVDLVLTDPPYGIGNWSHTGGNSLRKEEVEAINKWDVAPLESELKVAVEMGDVAVVWGGNYHELGPTRSPLIWDKGIRGMHYADGELAWTNFRFGTLRISTVSMRSVKGHRVHPTQKPVALMRWCIELSKTTGTILDPFAGSGTTGRAAKDLGRRCIMVEIEERYCQIAAKRLRQEVLSFPPD